MAWIDKKKHWTHFNANSQCNFIHFDHYVYACHSAKIPFGSIDFGFFELVNFFKVLLNERKHSLLPSIESGATSNFPFSFDFFFIFLPKVYFFVVPYFFRFFYLFSFFLYFFSFNTLFTFSPFFQWKQSKSKKISEYALEIPIKTSNKHLKL